MLNIVNCMPSFKDWQHLLPAEIPGKLYVTYQIVGMEKPSNGKLASLTLLFHCEQTHGTLKD